MRRKAAASANEGETGTGLRQEWQVRTADWCRAMLKPGCEYLLLGFGMAAALMECRLLMT